MELNKVESCYMYLKAELQCIYTAMCIISRGARIKQGGTNTPPPPSQIHPCNYTVAEGHGQSLTGTYGWTIWWPQDLVNAWEYRSRSELLSFFFCIARMGVSRPSLLIESTNSMVIKQLLRTPSHWMMCLLLPSVCIFHSTFGFVECSRLG